MFSILGTVIKPIRFVCLSFVFNSAHGQVYLNPAVGWQALAFSGLKFHGNIIIIIIIVVVVVFVFVVAVVVGFLHRSFKYLSS